MDKTFEKTWVLDWVYCKWSDELRDLISDHEMGQYGYREFMLCDIEDMIKDGYNLQVMLDEAKEMGVDKFILTVWW